MVHHHIGISYQTNTDSRDKLLGFIAFSCLQLCIYETIFPYRHYTIFKFLTKYDTHTRYYSHIDKQTLFTSILIQMVKLWCHYYIDLFFLLCSLSILVGEYLSVVRTYQSMYDCVSVWRLSDLKTRCTGLQVTGIT